MPRRQQRWNPCWAAMLLVEHGLYPPGKLPPVWHSNVTNLGGDEALVLGKSVRNTEQCVFFLFTSLRELNPWLDGWENNQEKP